MEVILQYLLTILIISIIIFRRKKDNYQHMKSLEPRLFLIVVICYAYYMTKAFYLIPTALLILAEGGIEGEPFRCWLQKHRKLIDLAFLASLLAHILYLQLSTTLFFVSTQPSTIHIIFAGACIFGGCRVLIGWNQTFSRRQAYVTLILTIPMVLCWQHYQYEFFIYLAIFLLGSLGLDYHKVLKGYIIVTSLFLVITFIASCSGEISNLVYIVQRSDGTKNIRSSMGICYPTDCAAYLFYLLLALWIEYGQRYKWMITGLAAVAVIFAKKVNNAQNSTIFLALLVGISIMVILYERFAGKKDRVCRLVQILLYMSASAFPVCGFLMYKLTMHYGTITDINDMAQLNSLFHSRLNMGYQAITNYGIHWFGNYYNQIGAGFSQTMPAGYNFIDSAYILLLVRYGILVSAVFVIGFVVASIRGTKAGNVRMSLAVMLIAGHSVLEHHAPELNYNIFLLLPVLGIAKHENREESILNQIKGMLHQNKILQIWTGTIVVFALFLICRLDYVISLIRTVVTVTGSSADEKGKKIFIWMLLVVIGMVAGIFYAWYQLGAQKSRGKSVCDRLMHSKRVLTGMISISIIGLSAVMTFVHHELSLGMSKYAPVIAEEQNVLDWINQTDNPRLYVDDVPVLYHKANANNTYSVYSLEDLARKNDSTILTKKENQSKILLDRGFLFAEISEEHAIYTTDREVIDLLREKGYHFTSYYSAQREVDLNYMAECNGLEQGDNGELILTSEHNVMSMGPYAYLWSGDYKATYHLRIPPETERSEEELCTLVVSANYGNNVRKEQKVYLDEFAEDGSLTVEVPFSVGNANGVEFKAFLNGDRQVDMVIEKITYRQTVPYDTIYYYDENGQNNRIERYDEEGNRILQDGCWAIEYEYNKAGQNTVRRYYDENSAPVKIADGYAEIHCEYNAANKLVRESYYDEAGQLICSNKGYAVEEREYDQYGNAYEYRYYGEDGSLILRPEGYAIAKYEYDDKNRCIAAHLYGTDGEPVLKDNSFATITYVLDEAGNRLEERTFDVNGEPVICQSGYAEVHRQFNENRRVIREAYYDVDGKLLMRNGDYAIIEYEYDEAGNVAAKRFYGTMAEPILYHDDFWQVRSIYNENRKAIHEEYYGLDGGPVLRACGYASYDVEYDRNGNATVFRYYDTSGKPIVNSWGYAEIYYSYSEKNQNIYETYYNADGARIDIGGGRYATGREYDEAGNVISIRYFGAEDEPVMYNADYHEVRYTYNEKKQIIREEFYDADRRPELNSRGFFADEREYDADGNQSSIRYYDLQGNEISLE